jgi:hypothetical protein
VLFRPLGTLALKVSYYSATGALGIEHCQMQTLLILGWVNGVLIFHGDVFLYLMLMFPQCVVLKNCAGWWLWVQ